MSEDRYSMSDSFGNDIVLSDEQKRCIDYTGRSVLVIKGTAGSGKSLMLAKLALNIRKDAMARGTRVKMLVVSYNKTLNRGLRGLFTKNGISFPDDCIEVINIDRLIYPICKRAGIIPKGDIKTMGMGDDDRIAVLKDVLK